MNVIKIFNHITRLVIGSKRFVSAQVSLSSQEKLEHRARTFNEEKHKQLKAVERIEKIKVRILESGQECTLVMNKNLSTPYNCSLRMISLSF